MTVVDRPLDIEKAIAAAERALDQWDVSAELRAVVETNIERLREEAVA